MSTEEKEQLLSADGGISSSLAAALNNDRRLYRRIFCIVKAKRNLEKLVEADVSIATLLASDNFSRIEMYKKLFPLEIRAWCDSISSFYGEINDEFVYDILDIIYPAFREAIMCGIAFNVIDTAGQITKAAKYLVDERVIAFKILSCLPDPESLNDFEQLALSRIIQTVEKEYKGALQYVERKWIIERNKQKMKRS